ncbi:UNVERIFIED_CONTAM: hypothetical protein GTU68_062660, partial [Idotea baltica]|nr:hypothetical protein [Idotea baltica]
AEIQGPPEVFIRNGSTISLTCIVKSKSEDLGSVAWTKEGVVLDYDSSRGGVSLEVEKTPTRSTSKLFITKAKKADSGTYICSPQFAQPASVVVHVVNGEDWLG